MRHADGLAVDGLDTATTPASAVGAIAATLLGAAAVIARTAIPAAASARRNALAMLSVAPCCRRSCSKVQSRCWLHAAVRSLPLRARPETSHRVNRVTDHGHYHDLLRDLSAQHRALRQDIPDVYTAFNEAQQRCVDRGRIEHQGERTDGHGDRRRSRLRRLHRLACARSNRRRQRQEPLRPSVSRSSCTAGRRRSTARGPIPRSPSSPPTGRLRTRDDRAPYLAGRAATIGVSTRRG